MEDNYDVWNMRAVLTNTPSVQAPQTPGHSAVAVPQYPRALPPAPAAAGAGVDDWLMLGRPNQAALPAQMPTGDIPAAGQQAWLRPIGFIPGIPHQARRPMMPPPGNQGFGGATFQQCRPAAAAPAPVKPHQKLADQLAAIGTLEQRALKLEACKDNSEYKTIFSMLSHSDEAPNPNGPCDRNCMQSAAPPAAHGNPAAESASSAVRCQLIPEYEEVTSSALSSLKVVVSLKATSEVLRPANLSLAVVVDKSSSMSGSKIDLVKGTVDFLADKLGADDALSLVSYSDLATRDLPLLLMSAPAKALAKAVNAGIQVDGCTALHDGLMLAVHEHATQAAASAGRDERRHVRSIFLCTDGQANVGPSDALSIISSMRNRLASLAQLKESVSIHTFGFGSDHDAKLLHAIAEAGSGMYYYISSDAQIPEAFGDALGGLLSVVASNAVVRVSAAAVMPSGTDGGAAVEIRNINSGGIVHEAPGPSNSYGQASISFTDLFAEESRELLLDLKLPAAPAGAKQGEQLITVEVSFTEPMTGKVQTASHTLAVKRSEISPGDQGQRSMMVEAAAARYRVAEAVRIAGELTEAQQYDEAQRTLLQAGEFVTKEGAGGDEQAHQLQLSNMLNGIATIKSNRHSQQARTSASICMSGQSKAMVSQRSAGVGLTTGMGTADTSTAAAGLNKSSVPQGVPFARTSWGTSSAYRQKVSKEASTYVASQHQMPK